MTRIFACLAALFACLPLHAQYRSVPLSPSDLQPVLDAAPREGSILKSNAFVDLPLPGGGTARFEVFNSPVFAAPLAEKHPKIGSFLLRGPWGTGRMAVSESRGLDVLARGPKGYFALEKNASQPDEYLVFYSADYGGQDPVMTNLACGFKDRGLASRSTAGGAGLDAKAADPQTLLQYDLLMTCTGEFAERVGGTQQSVLEAYNAALNVVNAIFRNDVGMVLRLIPETEQLIYLDPDTDPFTNANVGGDLLDQVQDAFNAAGVAFDRYDLGHIFTGSCTDVGGVVSGNACTIGKSEGVTCVGGDIARAAERIMAHEIAHQFAVSHSWNNCPGSEAQRAGRTAFEPGSGTTIMSYAGTCGSQNVGAGESYYHVGSLQQFLTYTRVTGARGCATVIETDNLQPEVELDYRDGFYVPNGTPFVLEGTATDENPGDALTYTWEQYDLGPVVNITDPRSTAPTFRSFAPSAEGNVRFFPRLSLVVNGVESDREALPDYAREMNFRLTVRDNNEQSGAVAWEQVRFFTAEAGPFVVNDPITADDTLTTAWAAGEYREISWEVNGTDSLPINTKEVDILLSTDGGQTFPTVLAAGVANTGSAGVTVPEMVGNENRIMVRAVGNIYYNVNANFFSIEAPRQAGFTLQVSDRYESVCLPDTVAVRLETGSVLDYAGPVDLTVLGEELPAGLEVRLADNTITAQGGGTDLVLDLSRVATSGRIVVPILAVAPGVDTTRREIVLDITSTDYSDLAVQSPAEGTTGIVLATGFDWTNAVNAESFDIEIATSPAFTQESLFERGDDLPASEYLPEGFFEPNTLYFWRVRGGNDCGGGEWTAPRSFRTVNTDCRTVTNDDPNLNLPGQGPAYTRTSELLVTENGTISDLNIPNIDLRYEFVSKVKLSLTSPAGTTVVLYDEDCFSTNRLDLGFDDDAPQELACPPDDRRVFLPADSLSRFNGESTFGTWVLSIEVSETGGSNGQLRSWSLQFCADLEAEPPLVINEEVSIVERETRTLIPKTDLRVESPVTASRGVTYTLTRAPAGGFLDLFGQRLAVGDHFTQNAINGEGLSYNNLDPALEVDDFEYVVTTEDGGYLPIRSHGMSLVIRTSTAAADPFAGTLAVYPNPAAERVSLRWTNYRGREELAVQLFDASGRQLGERRLRGRSGSLDFAIEDLPAGVYFLRAGGAVRRVVKR